VHYSNRFVFLPLLPFLVNPASLDVDPFQHWHSNLILNLIELRLTHFLNVRHWNRFVFLHVFEF
jgi:hypothetical protein